MRNFIKKYLWDIILIGGVLLCSLTALIVILTTSTQNNTCYIYQDNEVVEVINLATSEDKTFVIQGYESPMTIEIKDHKIRVLESDCPHHDCVNQGWSNKSSKPIICAYNHVCITFNKNSNYDVELG